MFEYDLEKIGNAVSKHSAILKGLQVLSKKFWNKLKKKWQSFNSRNSAFWMYAADPSPSQCILSAVIKIIMRNSPFELFSKYAVNHKIYAAIQCYLK